MGRIWAKQSVHFSGKITHSIIAYVEQRGRSAEKLIQACSIPEEFLRDAASWIAADEVEGFLARAQEMREILGLEDIVESAGLASAELLAWGGLDSVIRMLAGPEDILYQPERLFSYFISPAPPLGQVQELEQGMSFQFPMAPSEWPMTVQFLRAALSALPTFWQEVPAEVEWRETELQITWQKQQASLFSEESESQRQMSPQFMQSLVQTLEENQKRLEESNRELMIKNQQLEEAQEKLKKNMQERIYSEKLSGLAELAAAVAHEVNSPIAYVKSNLFRLNDYMTRASQLVTSAKKELAEREEFLHTLQKTDWEYISKDFPALIGESQEGLLRIQEIVKDLSFLAKTSKIDDSQKVETDLNQLVERVLKMAKATAPEDVQIESHLMMDRPIQVDPIRVEQALTNFVNNGVQAVSSHQEGRGTLRVITRPHGSMAEIEITDTGMGMDEETLSHIFTPFFTTKKAGQGTGLGLSIAHSIVKMHEGQVHVSSAPGRGSTFTIELPQSR